MRRRNRVSEALATVRDLHSTGRMRHLASGVAILCATFGSYGLLGAQPNGTLEVTVEVAEPKYDGLQTLLDEEARLALAEGKFRRARRLFLRLLDIDPTDVRAMR